jgi:hypothetical protein
MGHLLERRSGRSLLHKQEVPRSVECWSCLVVRSDSGNKTGSPDSVVSFNVSIASGFEFSEATTTAPVHATMPGSFLMATGRTPFTMFRVCSYYRSRRYASPNWAAAPRNVGRPSCARSEQVFAHPSGDTSTARARSGHVAAVARMSRDPIPSSIEALLSWPCPDEAHRSHPLLWSAQ